VRFFGGVFGIYRKLEPQRTQRRTGNSLEIAVCSSDRSKSLSSWMDPPAHAGGTDLISQFFSVPSVVNDLKLPPPQTLRRPHQFAPARCGGRLSIVHAVPSRRT